MFKPHKLFQIKKGVEPTMEDLGKTLTLEGTIGEDKIAHMNELH